MKRKIGWIVLVMCVLLSVSAALTSCELYNVAGVTDARINENGELILTYSDGEEQNLGVVVGKDGADGQDGQNGADGQEGKSGADGKNGNNGKDGVDGADGSLVITTDGSSIPAASAKGLRSAVRIICKFQTTVQQGGWFPNSGSASTRDYSSEGSGVIYQMDRAAGDAFILTNYHVVYDVSSNAENGISDDISVYLYGSEYEGKDIKATYVGGSLYYDVAVLRVENSELLKASSACAVTVADSDKVVVEIVPSPSETPRDWGSPPRLAS